MTMELEGCRTIRHTAAISACERCSRCDAEEVQQAVDSGFSGREWRDFVAKIEERPERERVRAEQKKAAAEAATNPKPTSIPKLQTAQQH